MDLAVHNRIWILHAYQWINDGYVSKFIKQKEVLMHE